MNRQWRNQACTVVKLNSFRFGRKYSFILDIKIRGMYAKVRKWKLMCALWWLTSRERKATQHFSRVCGGSSVWLKRMLQFILMCFYLINQIALRKVWYQAYYPNYRSDAEYLEFWQCVQNWLTSLFGLSKPTVAAVNGHAIAGGAAMALMCDYRYYYTEYWLHKYISTLW